MTKKVYLEPPWLMHAGQQRLVDHPPAGYEIVVKETTQEKVFRTANRSDALRFILRSSDMFLPTGLVKSWLERNNKPPAGAVLTYAVDHLVFRSEPWVMEVEFASLLSGRNPKHLKRFKGIMERTLASSHCRKILCVFEAGRRTLLADLDSRDFQHKTEVVRYSVPTRNFVKEYGGEKVKLLFIGADTLRSSEEAFEYKGGREVMETFAQLRSRFNGLELVVRSKVPPEIKARYQGLEGLRIIEDYIPWEELEQEYLSADISILPSHTTIPASLLEAMSYELPVVTIDSWANAEYVEDGRTGLVGPRSSNLPYYYPRTSQVNFGTPEYNEAMRITDPKVVEGLAQRVRQLIENPELRKKMGKAARWEVEHGRFSLATVNAQLGRIFDEAIGQEREEGSGQGYPTGPPQSR